MMDAISGALTAVSSLMTLSKDISTAKTEHEVAVKSGELNERLGGALQQLIAAQTAYLALLSEKGELESELVKLRDWAHEKQRYYLHRFPTGTLAYRIQPDAQGTEPLHEICADCYQKGIKTILQACEDGWFKALKCHPCNSVIRTEEIPDSGPMVVSTGGTWNEGW